MYCKQCLYDLRRIASLQCPECGRAFDPADSRSFHRSSSRLRRFIMPGIRPRATIASLLLLIWSMTIMFDFDLVTGVISGPFVFVSVWNWWPWNLISAAIGAAVFTSILLWVITERSFFFGLAIIASLLSLPYSFFITLKLAMHIP